jgi:hypothetical protein
VRLGTFPHFPLLSLIGRSQMLFPFHFITDKLGYVYFTAPPGITIYYDYIRLDVLYY